MHGFTLYMWVNKYQQCYILARVVAFHGHKNDPAELKVIGETNGSTEYALKLTKTGDVNAPERIRAARTALDAKRIDHTVKTNSTWDTEKVDNVKHHKYICSPCTASSAECLSMSSYSLIFPSSVEKALFGGLVPPRPPPHPVFVFDLFKACLFMTVSSRLQFKNWQGCFFF